MKYPLAILVLCTVLTSPGHAALLIQVPKLAVAPVIDGDSSEWSDSAWHEVSITPAKEGDKKNYTGEITVKIAAGHHEGALYLVARWPDKKADEEYLPWVWKGKKYRKGKQRDDMFALRFDMGGDFNECMIADADYKVDVWLWSAGRSNPAGYAEDMWHLITTQMQENAAEYESPSGKVVYIIKRRDASQPFYKSTRPNRKKNQGKKLPGIEQLPFPSGSVADIKAKGQWKDGYWTLELTRLMTTGNEDDVAIKVGDKIRAQIAVFNKGNSDHKSVSAIIEFEFLP